LTLILGQVGDVWLFERRWSFDSEEDFDQSLWHLQRDQTHLSGWTMGRLSSDRIFQSGRVNFINVFRTFFSYERRFGSFFYIHVTRKNCRNNVHTKKYAKNVDEIVFTFVLFLLFRMNISSKPRFKCVYFCNVFYWGLDISNNPVIKRCAKKILQKIFNQGDIFLFTKQYTTKIVPPNINFNLVKRDILKRRVNFFTKYVTLYLDGLTVCTF